ncbi:MAG TPA: hypothetical protein VF474_13870, partial [Phenylobacterium sp.]
LSAFFFRTRQAPRRSTTFIKSGKEDTRKRNAPRQRICRGARALLQGLRLRTPQQRMAGGPGLARRRP